MFGVLQAPAPFQQCRLDARYVLHDANRMFRGSHCRRSNLFSARPGTLAQLPFDSTSPRKYAFLSSLRAGFPVSRIFCLGLRNTAILSGCR